MTYPVIPPKNKSKKYNYSHLSINISKKGQLFVINEIEAKKRLAAKHRATPVDASSSQISNQAILNKIHATTKNSSGPLNQRPTIPSIKVQLSTNNSKTQVSLNTNSKKY